MTVVVEARDVTRIYRPRGGLFGARRPVRAVERVSLTVGRGETLGIVGESGSGKSTLGRLLLGLDPAAAGTVRFLGEALPPPGTPAWRALRARMQIIYQDPLAALDPRMTVGEQIAEPLAIHRLGAPEARAARVQEAAVAVGLHADHLGRYPHQLSGGQRQRAVIARAMVSQPELLVCDEPVSALDVSIQAQVVNTLRRLQRGSGIAMVFISHDLKVVRNIAHRVVVMYLGHIVEEAPASAVFRSPLHPYTAALVSSVPVPGKPLRDRIILEGEPPNPSARPSGCPFHPRCRLAVGLCATSEPALRQVAPGRHVACHLVGEEASCSASS